MERVFLIAVSFGALVLAANSFWFFTYITYRQLRREAAAERESQGSRWGLFLLREYWGSPGGRILCWLTALFFLLPAIAFALYGAYVWCTLPAA